MCVSMMMGQLIDGGWKQKFPYISGPFFSLRPLSRQQNSAIPFIRLCFINNSARRQNTSTGTYDKVT
jgi:hypothetical protein